MGSGAGDTTGSTALAHGSGTVAVADRIVVLVTFQGNSNPPEVLKEGYTGVVSQIDPDGDAYISFLKPDGTRFDEWVLGSNFHKLKKVDLAPVMAQLQNELSVCQRELAFSRSEFQATETRALEADRSHSCEVAELRAQVRDLTGRVSSAYLRGSEDGLAAQQALDVARSELGEMCSQVLMAQEEVEFAQAVHGGSRSEWDKARELAARREEVEQKSLRLKEERSRLEGLLPSLQEELRKSEEGCRYRRSEVQSLEETFKLRELEVGSYEMRARELHHALRNVMGELRSSYDGAQKEKLRLEAHIANLEGREAQSPGHDPWWGSPSASSSQPPVIEQPALGARPPARRPPATKWQPLPPRTAVREAEREARERQRSLLAAETRRTREEATLVREEASSPSSQRAPVELSFEQPTSSSASPQRRRETAPAPGHKSVAKDPRWSNAVGRSELGSPAPLPRKRTELVNNTAYSPHEVRKSAAAERNSLPADGFADRCNDCGIVIPAGGSHCRKCSAVQPEARGRDVADSSSEGSSYWVDSPAHSPR